MRGAATGKARLPTVDSLTEGTTRRLVPAERSVRRPCRSATGTNGPRYRGALPCNTLYVSTGSSTCIGGPHFDIKYERTIDQELTDAAIA